MISLKISHYLKTGGLGSSAFVGSMNHYVAYLFQGLRGAFSYSWHLDAWQVVH